MFSCKRPRVGKSEMKLLFVSPGRIKDAPDLHSLTRRWLKNFGRELEPHLRRRHLTQRSVPLTVTKPPVILYNSFSTRLTFLRLSLSTPGLYSFLSTTLFIFTKDPYSCVPLFSDSESRCLFALGRLLGTDWLVLPYFFHFIPAWFYHG